MINNNTLEEKFSWESEEEADEKEMRGLIYSYFTVVGGLFSLLAGIVLVIFL